MNSRNLKNKIKLLAPAILLVVSLGLIGFVPPLVDGSNPPGHDSVTETLVEGTNVISLRDISITDNKTSTVQVDASTAGAGFIEIFVTDDDANLDTGGMDVILSSATSQSSGTIPTFVELHEIGDNTGTFSGRLFLSSSTQEGSLKVGPSDSIFVSYDEEKQGVARFSATLKGVIGPGTVELKDILIEKASDIKCPDVLFTDPVTLTLTSASATGVDVSISWANSNRQNVEPSPTNFGALALQMLYQEPGKTDWIPLTPTVPFGPFFIDISGHLPLDAKIITNIDQPPQVEGSYALGFDDFGCSGGGGGGLVRPGLVVNALAGSGSVLRLFTGGSGVGAVPTFGDASLMVLGDQSEGIGGTISEGDDISLDSTKVVQTGDTAVLRFELSENQGINNLERFRMFLNFEGENYDASTIDTHISYERGGEITIVDPNEKIEIAEIEILQVDPWNLIVNVKIIFKNTFNTSILVESWDLDRNSGKKLFPDVLEVVEPSILLADAQKVLNEPISDLIQQDVSIETELTEIPVWIKSNALWWQQKQIDDSDFMAGIEYLIKKSLIEIDENNLSYSETSKETPLWISDIAGMWANDSITDKEFIDSMKWLITNGILQVQQ